MEKCTVNLYADDITIYTSDSDAKCVSMRLEEDLSQVAKWIMENGLKMNIAKTQLMVLSRKYNRRKSDDVQVRSTDQVLTKQVSVKYLGVHIGRDLNWQLHIDSVRKKYLAKLALIRRAGHYLPCSIRKLLYLAIVFPHLDYCSVVWHSCGTTLSDWVERIQNYAVRMILQKPPRTRSHPLRGMLGWTTLHHRRHLAMLGKVYRCLTNRAPAFLTAKFVANVVHNVNYPSTRRKNNLHLKRPLTNAYR